MLHHPIFERVKGDDRKTRTATKQTRRRREDEDADEQRCDRVTFRITGASSEQADEDRERAGEVSAEVEDVHGEGSAFKAAGRAERDVRAARVHDHDDPDDRERERVDVDFVPALDEPEDRARCDDERRGR